MKTFYNRDRGNFSDRANASIKQFIILEGAGKKGELSAQPISERESNKKDLISIAERFNEF